MEQVYICDCGWKMLYNNNLTLNKMPEITNRKLDPISVDVWNGIITLSQGDHIINVDPHAANILAAAILQAQPEVLPDPKPETRPLEKPQNKR